VGLVSAVTAFANHPILNGSFACVDGQQVITWTVTNSELTTASGGSGHLMQIIQPSGVSATGTMPSGINLGGVLQPQPLAGSTETGTTTLPGNLAEPVTLYITGHFINPDGSPAGVPDFLASFTVNLTGTCQAPCPGAPAGYPNLGAAAGYTVFALNGGTTQKVNFSLTTVNGNVAVASGATVTNQAPSTVKGNVYVDAGGSFGGPGKVTGTVFPNQSQVATARTAALSASSQAAALSPNFTYGNITSNTTVTGVSGLNVVDVNGNINLSNASLTLSGLSDAFFVVNVSGSITLGGNGGIVVGGSVSPSHLIINMTGSGNLINTHVGNVVQGTLLGPNVGGTLDGAFGSLLLGRDFSLMSGVTETFEGCPQ
jgi:hypothetical protein